MSIGDVSVRNQILQDLEYANKLIFVKRYRSAADFLESCLKKYDGFDCLYLHLRRIELACKLGNIDKIKEEYLQNQKQGDRAINKICLALANQHSNSVSNNESLSDFKQILEEFGETAITYYGLAYSLEKMENYERSIYNYQQSIKIDPDWFPSYFGLSQIHYLQNNEEKGDYYFYLFEKKSPYSLYGNFKTHKSLYREFLSENKFEESAIAISTLAAWWFENKGAYPNELKLYEQFALSEIKRKEGEATESIQYLNKAIFICESILEAQNTKVKELYFIARVMEEFKQTELAVKVYSKILSLEGHKPGVAQNIGGQFLALGNFETALQVFQESYEKSPNNEEIRLCLLITNLKKSNVDVEEYLHLKEQAQKYFPENLDKIELLSLLHKLLAIFEQDPDVHFMLGEVFQKMENPERSEIHFINMYKIDPYSKKSQNSYLSYLISNNKLVEAERILSNINLEDDPDIVWFSSLLHEKKCEYERASDKVRSILIKDPWNISYLILHVKCLINIKFPQESDNLIQGMSLESFSKGYSPEWKMFNKCVAHFESSHAYELAYCSMKIQFLMTQGNEQVLELLIKSACNFNTTEAIKDLLNILNTNLDRPNIYWGLGRLFTELWQLETASVWYEQTITYQNPDTKLKSRVFLDLARCYIWSGQNLEKSIALLQASLELKERDEKELILSLIHAHLKLGKIRPARILLQNFRTEISLEVAYLRGLLEYREGRHSKAKEIWKPLLIYKVKNRQEYHMKQEILRFYYDKEEYLKVN